MYNSLQLAVRWYPPRKGAFKALVIQTVKIEKQT